MWLPLVHLFCFFGRGLSITCTNFLFCLFGCVCCIVQKSSQLPEAVCTAVWLTEGLQLQQRVLASGGWAVAFHALHTAVPAEQLPIACLAHLSSWRVGCFQPVMAVSANVAAMQHRECHGSSCCDMLKDGCMWSSAVSVTTQPSLLLAASAAMQQCYYHKDLNRCNNAW